MVIDTRKVLYKFLCYTYVHAKYLQSEAMLRLVSLEQKVALKGRHFARLDATTLEFYRG